MTNKYKISDLAKDFGMKSRDIIDLITSVTGAEKKSGATLDEGEIELVFNKLTEDNSVKSFDAYFATGEEARLKAQKARQDEKNKKLAEQMAILEQLKAAAAAQNKEAAAEKEEKTQPESAKAKAAEQNNKKAEVKKETGDGGKKKSAKSREDDKGEQKTAAVKPKVDNAAESSKKEEAAAQIKKQKPKAEEKVAAKEIKPAPQEHKPSDPKPFTSQKKDKKPGAAPNRGPAEIRHVDTRTSNINIDKYNEKYESIAPANSMKDNYSRKQKITQKSQDYRRPQGAKRETEADKMRRMQLERIKKTPITVTVGDEITVGELAAALKKTAAEVIKTLMKLGMMASVNQVID